MRYMRQASWPRCNVIVYEAKGLRFTGQIGNRISRTFPFFNVFRSFGLLWMKREAAVLFLKD